MNLPDQDLADVATHMAIWHKLRAKRIFITGASGFIGTWLVESLLWANANLGLEAEIVRLPRTFPSRSTFDFGIHTAKADDFHADIELTRRALEFAAQSGVHRFLYTSSGAVYGNMPSETNTFTEDCARIPHPDARELSYAQSKRAGENLCAAFSRKFNFCTVIARLFAFAGPGLPLDRNFAVGNFVRDALSGGPIVIQGDGTSLRSYLYAADLAIWLWTLLLEGENATPYNVGSSYPVSILELAAIVAGQASPSLPVVIMGRNVIGAASTYVPSVQRAAADLGLRPLIPLAECIRRMYAWNLKSKSREMKASLPTTP